MIKIKYFYSCLEKPSNLSDLFDEFFHHADRTGNPVHSIFMPLETRLKTHGDPSNAQPLALYPKEFPKLGYFSGSSSLYGSCMVQVMLCCTDVQEKPFYGNIILELNSAVLSQQ